MKYMANTTKELLTASNVTVHLLILDKNISFCSLKYVGNKNEDCSLTYPNLEEKRKQTEVVSGLRAI